MIIQTNSEIEDKQPIKSERLNNTSTSLHHNGKFYDLFEDNAIGGARHSDDISFWRDIAKLYSGSILELGSGTGRVAIDLAELGFDVTGLEISDSMLSVAKTKSSQVSWIKGDACNFDLRKMFQLILFPYNGMLHIYSDELKSCFHTIKKHINLTGRLVIDIANPTPSILLKLFLNQGERLASIFEDPNGTGTVIVTQDSEYDAASQVITTKRNYRFTGTHKEVYDSFKRRIYFPEEIDTLLRWSGFEIEEKYGDYDFSPFTSDSPQQLIVCQPVSI
ncbi:MAG: class I SAM-dependent methyltransferase [Pseudanabaenaceae cyanobacterium]|jgi:SAM-dependent methyltransferase